MSSRATSICQKFTVFYFVYKQTKSVFIPPKMSSDEDDYMSDKFLIQEDVKNNRPGLVKNRTMQRAHEVEAKKAKLDEETRQRYKPLKIAEKERRDKGLSEAVSTNSKGFAMLTRMGYKEGESIGKSSSGIVEPLGITVKANRHGLGRESALEELRVKRIELKKEKMKLNNGETKEISTEEFRKRFSQKNDMRLIEGALR